MSHAIARTDEAVRRRIAELPDGTYNAAIEMDSDGVTPDYRPQVQVTVTIAGDHISRTPLPVVVTADRPVVAERDAYGAFRTGLSTIIGIPQRS